MRPHTRAEAQTVVELVDGRGDGFATPTLHASYLHTHPAGDPEAVARFVRACHPFVAGVADGTVFA